MTTMPTPDPTSDAPDAAVRSRRRDDDGGHRDHRGRHVLVTGGAGFIGSHLVARLLDDPEVHVTTLDALTYAGRRENLAEAIGTGAAEAGRAERAARLRFVHADVRDASALAHALDARSEPEAAPWPRVDTVCHLAAESHVDRSITGPAAFLDTNVSGTGVLLDAVRTRPAVKRVLHVSTDEVYGPVPAPAHRREDAPFAPSSPYAASKAGADLLAHAYAVTYDLPVVIVRPSNTYGPRQLPEKLIPRFITTLLRGGDVPLYGDGQHTRDWTHVDDTVEALLTALTHGEPGQAYNAGAGDERPNLEVAGRILEELGLGAERIERVADRPGHDRRYAIDSARLRALGWEPTVGFAWGLAATVAWYRDRVDWWAPALDELTAGAGTPDPSHPVPGGPDGAQGDVS